MAGAQIFTWSDEEVQLLLQVTLKYKTTKFEENIDWESCQSKYADIYKDYLEQYPVNGGAEGKDFPHVKSAITKAQVISKLKAVRGKYRRAVDSGRRSGHGRVVLIFFELCKQIWGGSPATSTLEFGIETADFEARTEDTTPSDSRSSTPHSECNEVSTAVKSRREMLQTKLRNQRQDRLKKRLNSDPALQEDLQIKRRMMDLLEESERRNAERLNKITETMENMTNCIKEGFSLLAPMMTQPQQPLYTPSGHMQGASEVPYGFCKDEQREEIPVCEFSLHQSPKVVITEQQVSELKEQLKSDLKSLQDKKDKCIQVEETYDDVIQHSKDQVLSTERQIRAEFNKLHQFLKEEEESRLAALREEEEQKGKTIIREMKRIQEQISSLSDSISAVEEDLQKDNVSFLSSYKATQSRTRAQNSLSDPQLVSGALIDVAKHLDNLSCRVWEKMKEKVHFSPVILDPNTANKWLHVPDDRTLERNGDTMQQHPNNPDRKTKCIEIFGSESFSSGKHSWEVEVKTFPDGTVGLVKKSDDRKGERDVTPENGI
ncbi:tripartite motif-containing protein 15-like [Girardinichthys multiradiatus]|uniref:tripartite motif-containing protein 15-like n=1 Tax=Girardinichthys multiradiatus TaxID=208333 RepID=UPI001FAB6D84|nr:tripartite motif-containing protein 15-like [Girardinichthys multiradiatus]